MKFVAKKPIKSLSLHRRHLGMTSLERIKAQKLKQMIVYATNGLKVLHAVTSTNNSHQENAIKVLKIALVAMMLQYQRLCYVKLEDMMNPLRYFEPKNRTIDSFREDEIHLYFRFRSRDQLRRLVDGFQFPQFMVTDSGHRFTAEEVLLVGLHRLSRPLTRD